MANRFLDTNYYKSPFVRSLKGALKSLYSFIICDCDGAGIWNMDLDAASLYTGFTITIEEFENHFITTGKAISIGKNKYFFPDFIEHQYPQGLQAKNPAHRNFIGLLKKFELIDENLIVKKGASKGLQSPIGNGLSNGNGQGNGNVLEGGTGETMVYDAEKEVLENHSVWFEQICMNRSKSLKDGKESLRKFHLYFQENSKYPKTKIAILAGFEKWLMNEKKFNYGTKIVGDVRKKPIPKINPEGGFGNL